MRTIIKDDFESIYKLTRNHRFSQALNRLQHRGNGHIKKEFIHDKNHAWYCIGDIYYKKKDYRSARNAFNNSLKSNPEDAEAMLAVANCHDALNNPWSAEKQLRKALKIETSKTINAKIKLNLSNALIDLNRHQEAIELLRKLKNRTDEIGRIAKSNYLFAKMRLKANP